LGGEENPDIPEPSPAYFYDEANEELFPETPEDDTSSQES
jgi:hypothetical protein